MHEPQVEVALFLIKLKSRAFHFHSSFPQRLSPLNYSGMGTHQCWGNAQVCEPGASGRFPKRGRVVVAFWGAPAAAWPGTHRRWHSCRTRTGSAVRPPWTAWTGTCKPCTCCTWPARSLRDSPSTGASAGSKQSERELGTGFLGIAQFPWDDLESPLRHTSRTA